ncbi:MAG: shikimate dehydrogenase [Bdellovibrionales bacterium]
MNAGYPKAAVLGWPVKHSLSPRLHGYWLHRYGIGGSYESLAVEPAELEKTLRHLPQAGFRGVNLTIPHKEKALAFMQAVDTPAQRIGAVNMVVVGEDGRLEGRNTDAYGFSQSLQEAGVSVRGGAAAVIGAGGAARAAIVALQDMGVSEIRLVNRTRERAEELKAALGGSLPVFDWAAREDALKDAGLLVNATSLGMQGQPPLDLALDNLPQTAPVTDIVYRPLETDLLRRAKQHGHPTVDGLGMLLHQARPAFAAFFGRDPDVTGDLRRHLLEAP